MYSFYQKFEEEAIEIDIPFVDQEKPLSKKILANTPEEDIKDKNSQEYQELQAIPKEELELFKKNGLSIDGQKNILEYLKANIRKDYRLIKWSYYPQYEQALYILELCFNNLMKPTENLLWLHTHLSLLFWQKSTVASLFHLSNHRFETAVS